MGRHRLSEDEKKVPFSTKIQKSLLDELREKLKQEDRTISDFIEQAIKIYLKK